MADGIYADWSTNDWFSGSSGDYPVLRYATISESVPLCGQPGQPVCGDLLGGQRILALRTLVLSRVGESTNLITDGFVPHITTYTITVGPATTTLDISLEPYDSGATVTVNDIAIDISTKTEIRIQGLSVLPITVKSGEAQHTYSVTIERSGVCDANDIDRDDDGLIEICSPFGLDAIRHQLDGSGYRENADAPIVTIGCNYNNTGTCRGYELGRDLELAEMDWQPIGNSDAGFAAIFDGNDHTISNLRITTTSTHVGLFAYTAQNSTITNVGLLSANVSGGEHVGSLVGTNRGTISNSYARGVVSATGSNAGGFIGTNSGTILNSYAECEVTGGTEGGSNTGGFIGTNSGTIRNSYAAGDVSGDAGVGGFIGTNSGTIRNGYAAGDVSGGAGVGGFIGFIDSPESGGIANSYSRGRVSGSGDVGGFIGFFTAGTRTAADYVTASYWDTERSGRTNSAGGTSQTTAALQGGVIGMADGIYAAWSPNDWDSGTRFDYPILKPTKGDDPVNPLCGGDERPCDILPAQFAPLNQLVLLAGTEASLSRQMLEPEFDPNHNMYRSTVRPQDDRIQFMIASPTTRAVSYQVDDGEFIDLQNDVGISPVSLPLSPLFIGLGTTRTIIIRVPPLATQTNQDSGGEYTIEVSRESISGVCDANDIDRDDDGLIELCSPIGLDAIRHQLDGSGYRVDADTPIITDGCNYNNTGTCRGYELGRDLDLADEMNWQPIGNSDAGFAAIFDGNNHTISNLSITTTTINVGLFAYTAQNSTITNVGLLSVNVSGGEHVGSLVGTNRGAISNSYARGVVSATGSNAGGFIGINSGTISNSYARGTVSATGGSDTGGFIGTNSGAISNSYAAGDVSGGTEVGGFIGTNSGTIRKQLCRR